MDTFALKNQQKGEDPNQQAKPITTGKRMFGVFLVFGIVALTFGAMKISNSLRGPFALSKNEASSLGSTGQTISTLSSRDTDGDTISDYDELYVFHTSPYLADSDSDGTNDAQELTKGADPNCPEGQTCSSLVLANVTNATNVATNGVVSPINAITNVANSNVNSQSSSSLTAAELRLALRNAGAPEATLNGIDDATLLAMYSDVVTESEGSTTGNATAAPTNTVTNAASPSSADLQTLQNFSPDQIRDFLQRGGADATTLQGIDDETLRGIFQDALGSIGQ